jgi:methylenetetrahydrofolate reductase (NADPH)
MDMDIYWLKEKMKAGAEYAVTQLFYDNERFFNFVNRARAEGVTIPIIPGIKPFKTTRQLTIIPKTFKVDIPFALASEVLKCKTEDEVRQVGVEWCIAQCKELIAHGVPSIHFYAMAAADSVKQVAKAIY